MKKMLLTHILKTSLRSMQIKASQEFLTLQLYADICYEQHMVYQIGQEVDYYRICKLYSDNSQGQRRLTCYFL